MRVFLKADAHGPRAPGAAGRVASKQREWWIPRRRGERIPRAADRVPQPDRTVRPGAPGPRRGARRGGRPAFPGRAARGADRPAPPVADGCRADLVGGAGATRPLRPRPKHRLRSRRRPRRSRRSCPLPPRWSARPVPARPDRRAPRSPASPRRWRAHRTRTWPTVGEVPASGRGRGRGSARAWRPSRQQVEVAAEAARRRVEAEVEVAEAAEPAPAGRGDLPCRRRSSRIGSPTATSRGWTPPISRLAASRRWSRSRSWLLPPPSRMRWSRLRSPSPEPSRASRPRHRCQPEVEADFEPEPVAAELEPSRMPPSLRRSPPELAPEPEPEAPAIGQMEPVEMSDAGEEAVMWLGGTRDAADEMEIATARSYPGPSLAPRIRDALEPVAWPATDRGASTTQAVAPPLAMTEEELAQLARDEGWDDAEVAAIRAMISRPSTATVELPGSAELDEAMSALQAVPIAPRSEAAARRANGPSRRRRDEETRARDDWAFEVEPEPLPSQAPPRRPRSAAPRGTGSGLAASAPWPGGVGLSPHSPHLHRLRSAWRSAPAASAFPISARAVRGGSSGSSCSSASSSSVSLPSLARIATADARSTGWRWRPVPRRWRRAAWVVLAAFRDLGRSLTPMPRPRDDAVLVENGIYADHSPPDLRRPDPGRLRLERRSRAACRRSAVTAPAGDLLRPEVAPRGGLAG